MYTDVNVNISDSQKQKVKKALAAGTQLSLRLSHEDLVGNDVIPVTQSQLNRLKKAHQAGKGVTIKMSESQVAYNMKLQGGFLPLLAGLASQALPFLRFLLVPFYQLWVLVRYQVLLAPECKKFCNWKVLVQLIIENVVTCFLRRKV